jgi:hypothetical protein
MIYCNFLQWITTQNRIWSSLMYISTQEEHNEIYFIFFW